MITGTSQDGMFCCDDFRQKREQSVMVEGYAVKYESSQIFEEARNASFGAMTRKAGETRQRRPAFARLLTIEKQKSAGGSSSSCSPSMT
jgi:hypothetical protein